jgi:hypothetical protein
MGMCSRTGPCGNGWRSRRERLGGWLPVGVAAGWGLAPGLGGCRLVAAGWGAAGTDFGNVHPVRLANLAAAHRMWRSKNRGPLRVLCKRSKAG